MIKLILIKTNDIYFYFAFNTLISNKSIAIMSPLNMNFKNIFASILCIMLMASCARNPVTGKRELSFMSEEKEIALGKQSDGDIVKSFGLYQNSEIQKFIEIKGKEMAAVSHRSHLNFDFKVLDSPVVNAFAIPGGYVYFTRGILAHFNNEAEFAGVLGHEIGHVTAKHSVSQMSKQQLMQGLFIGGIVLSEDFRQYADVASQGMGLMFLKFGRDDESQSDKLGVEYSTKVGYDSHNMANFFKTLKRLSGESTIPAFMSTHPDPADRNEKVHELSDEWQDKLNVNTASLKTNRDSYLRMIDGLTYGEDPQQGFVQNGKFYHPSLKFEFDIPSAWQLQNQPSQVVMSPQDGKALMVMTLASGVSLDKAKSDVIESNKLNVIETAQANVNGLRSVQMTSNQTQAGANGAPAKVIRILTYLIEYGSNIYVFHGMSEDADFNRNFGGFQTTMRSFKILKDPAIINKQSEKIAIITNNAPRTLSAALTKFSIPTDRHEEIAILNGMMLTDMLAKGQLYKSLK